MVWLAVFVFLGLVAVAAIGRNRAKLGAPGAATAEILVDGTGARRVLADGREEGVDWSELSRVEIVPARRGPHAAAGGVVMLAGDDERGCLVPLDRLGDTGLVEHLERLPAFSVDGFVAALQEPGSEDRVVWTRPG